MAERIRTAIVGLRMGAAHARAVASLDHAELAGVCDIAAETAEQVADECAQVASERGSVSLPGVYTDYAAMLAELRPQLVGIATPNRLHCEMTIQAVEAGAKAIYCEKPIAVDLGEARRMVAACREAGVQLVINHQRRTGPDFAWIREQIDAGAIGEVYLVRGDCAGDMLSDGTHLVDSVLYLTGDRSWSWVFAAHYREATGPPEIERTRGTDGATGGGYDKVDGWRFGHPIEDGMMTVAELENGIRLELLTGDLRMPDRPYHDIEIIGTEGSLLRRGDKPGENLLHRGSSGAWEAVTGLPEYDSRGLIRRAYEGAVDLVRSGDPDSAHPMGAPYAMRGFELLMGAYESARTRSLVRPPVAQDRYPLAVELGLADH